MMRAHGQAKTDVRRGNPIRSIHRLDDRGVSPVIATILLVAITVILAGVLYVMVSSLFRPVDNVRALGIALTKSGNGLNWTLTVVTTPVGLLPSDLRLTIFAPSGATSVTKTFSSLIYSTDGAVFVGSGSTIAAGDRILIDANRYPTHYSVQIEDSMSVLYTTIFP